MSMGNAGTRYIARRLQRPPGAYERKNMKKLLEILIPFFIVIATFFIISIIIGILPYVAWNFVVVSIFQVKSITFFQAIIMGILINVFIKRGK